MAYRFCKFLINRHHLYPGQKGVPFKDRVKRGSIEGLCVRQHLRTFASECCECDEKTPGPPIQTEDEYWEEVGEEG